VDLARLLGVQKSPARFAVFGRVPSMGGVTVEAVEVATAPKVWIPAWLFLPGAPGDAAYLLLEPTRNQRWREDDLYQELARAGAVVCAPDPRGFGDLSPEFGRGAARHANEHHTEEMYAWASLMLGKPMLGQRVTDILAVTEALLARPEARGRRLVVASSGLLNAAALLAASLDRRINGLYLRGGVPSFEKLAKTENYEHSLADFVPGILRYTDLPEIASSLKGTKIVEGGAWDRDSLGKAL
jgi:pimeloyl-ACP methyl ester carboxylesterase